MKSKYVLVVDFDLELLEQKVNDMAKAGYQICNAYCTTPGAPNPNATWNSGSTPTHAVWMVVNIA